MSIDNLQPAPPAVYDHGTVREKINEVIDSVNLTVLDPAIYGNFNAIQWASLSTGEYLMSALGSQILAASPTYEFLPASTYIFQIRVINEPGEYRVKTVFTTDSDFSNTSIGRESQRAGADFGSSVTIGWKTTALVEDLPLSFVVLSQDPIAVSSNPLATTFFSGFALYGTINGFTLDAATGAIINSSGRTISSVTGTISIQPVKIGGGAAQELRLWSEVSPDGITWAVNANSLRTFEVASDGETFKTSVSLYADWVDGEYLRFKCYSTGGGSLSIEPTSDTVDGQAITGPSVIWNLKED